jgi:hypothetical protein
MESGDKEGSKIKITKGDYHKKKIARQGEDFWNW